MENLKNKSFRFGYLNLNDCVTNSNQIKGSDNLNYQI